MEIITLSNGKRVANFSSPHSFKFEDGSVLPSQSPEIAEKLKVTFIETELHDGSGDVYLEFELSERVRIEMDRWMRVWKEHAVDVVYCPLPMITALKQEGYNLISSPFRSIRIEDRIKKLVSIHKQCI
jgi:hypothetical protein